MEPQTHASIQAFLLWAQRNLSASTVGCYGHDLRTFERFLLKQGRVGSILDAGPREAIEFDRTLQAKNRAYATRARARASIRSFFEFLVKQKMLTRNPMATLPTMRVPRSPAPRMETEDLLTRLMLPATDNPRGLRDRAILQLLVDTGMRISEALALNTNSFDLKKGEVRCVGQRGRVRLLKLDPKTVEALEAYAAKRDQLVKFSPQPAFFLNDRGGRLTRQGYWLQLKSFMPRGEDRQAISLRQVRHAAARTRLARGQTPAQVSQTLGYRDKSRVQQVYA